MNENRLIPPLNLTINYLKPLGFARAVTIIASTILVMFINVHFGVRVPAEEMRIIEMATEGFVAIIFLVWLVAVPSAQLSAPITNILFTGFLLMYIGFVQDSIEECFDIHTYGHWKNILEDLPVPLGTAIASAGFLMWARQQAKQRQTDIQQKEEFKHLSLTDELTNVGNNRALHQQLKVAVKQAAEQQTPLSAAMLDLDRFKYLNDTYGHQAGDQVLRQFGQLLLDKVRDQDLAFRYGGEEFTLLLSNTTQEQAYSILERIRLNLMQQAFHFDGSDQPVRITVSVGVAQLRPTDESDQLLQRADRAVYQAKRLGRNRTVISEE